LVTVFYIDLAFDGENIWSHVKGVDMEISPKVWFVVAGLKYKGLKVSKGVMEEFNKM